SVAKRCTPASLLAKRTSRPDGATIRDSLSGKSTDPAVTNCPLSAIGWVIHSTDAAISSGNAGSSVKFESRGSKSTITDLRALVSRARIRGSDVAPDEEASTTSSGDGLKVSVARTVTSRD